MYGFDTSVSGYDPLTGRCMCGNESVGSVQGETFVLCWFVGLLICLIACLFVGLNVYLLLCYLHSQLHVALSVTQTQKNLYEYKPKIVSLTQAHTHVAHFVHIRT